MLLSLQVFNMSSVSLTEGGSYYPTVLAWNNAGPPLYTAYTAGAAVSVDTTGPTGGQVFNTWVAHRPCLCDAKLCSNCRGLLYKQRCHPLCIVLACICVCH